jgi:hypothetical protein
LYGRKEFATFRRKPDKWGDGEQEKLRQIHNDFLDLAINSGVTGLVEAIDLREYNALAGIPANKEMFGGTPYYLCYHLAMRRAISAVKELEESDPASSAIVAFVCDGHEAYSEHMKTVHEDFRRADPADSRLIGSFTYDDDKQLIALQAADALVYEVRKDLFEQMEDSAYQERPELSVRRQAFGLVVLPHAGMLPSLPQENVTVKNLVGCAELSLERRRRA